MAKMIPNTISKDCKSSAEYKFFNLMRDAKGTENWIVLHSINIANHTTQIQGEVDFVVLAPELGVFFVEVKGGAISFENGKWHTTNREGKNFEIKNPINEATEAMKSLKNFVFDKIDNGKFDVNYKHNFKKQWWHWCVCFPDSTFNDILPDLNKLQVIDNSIFRDKNITSFFVELSKLRDKNFTPPTIKDCKDVVNILRPNIKFNITLTEKIENMESQLVKLTDRQQEVFEGLLENERCIVSGEAGTGKTILAINYYKSLAQSGAKVKLFCYNKQLAKYIDKNINYTGAVITCFTGYMESFINNFDPDWLNKEKKKIDECVNKKIKHDYIDKFYRELLPEKFCDVFIENGEVVDYLIIDESQDILTKEYIDVFDLILAGGLQEGKWLFFQDSEKQNIYNKQFDDEVQETIKKIRPAKYKLKDNCRNSKAIFDKVSEWFDVDSRTLVTDVGEAVKIIPYRDNIDEQKENVEGILTQLVVKDKIAPKDIVILSPKTFGNSIVSKLAQDNFSISLEKENDKIYFSTIHAFKGLENKVVVLCDIEELFTGNNSKENKNLFYVGMTRAKSALYININKKDYQKLCGGKE